MSASVSLEFDAGPMVQTISDLVRSAVNMVSSFITIESLFSTRRSSMNSLVLTRMSQSIKPQSSLQSVVLFGAYQGLMAACKGSIMVRIWAFVLGVLYFGLAYALFRNGRI
jgi:hypothetical protein